MRVGLDLLYLVPGETGGRETYARELIPAMLAQEPELELVAFVNRDAGPRLAAELGDGVRAVVLPISARSRAQWTLGELALVSVAARRARVELLHSMANFAPAWGPFKRVVTIHDLQYRAVPDLLSWPMRTGTSALMWLAAHRTHRVIADSRSTRNDLIDLLGVDPNRIDVIPLGVSRPQSATPASTSGLRDRLRLAGRTLALAVATDLPHKNLAALIEALALIPPSTRPLLVIVVHGTDGEALAERASTAGVSRDVRLLGHCSSEQLESLYALADCLVVPSLHEGFGLPALEAMRRSVPVVCSDIPALREVASSAALYFDPRMQTEIAARISEVTTNASLAKQMADHGDVRAAEFSWSTAAEGTLQSYSRALGG
jgi:glycosyltransferase involved in cell wall biosynthesis